MIKTLSTKSLYKDRWVEFFQDEIELEDGTTSTYAWAKRLNGVGVAVVTTDKKILLHKEYRYVIKEFSWEIQGGGIDQGETPEQAAARELKEEAGVSVKPESLIRIGKLYPLHSFATEICDVFMVVIESAELTTSGNEAGEYIIDQKFFSFDKALDMVDSGEVNDAFTASIIQMAIRKMERKRLVQKNDL